LDDLLRLDVLVTDVVVPSPLGRIALERIRSD
jgi:hypothetical protein